MDAEKAIGMILTMVAFSMLVISSLVMDVQGYVDSYATEDDSHLH